MSGRLIVIEGLDGSGKSTQLEQLKTRLGGHGDVRFVKFPDYEDPSSTLVKMYLDGRFGEKPGDVNCYAASAFYAVDRYASFKQHWKSDYDSGKIILCDRYVSSNAVHQCSKLPRSEWPGFLDWLYDFEFCKMGIPRPDATVFLDMPVSVSQRLMTGRYGGAEAKKDIHERDTAYLEKCRSAALFSAERLGWIKIRCSDGDEPLPIGEIADSIFREIQKIL